MLSNFLPLFGSFLLSDLWEYFFIPIFCLAFIATVPCVIRACIRFGGR